MQLTLDKNILREIPHGDYEDNSAVDTACADRLLLLCRDYGDDGNAAQVLIRIALKKIDVYATV